MHRCRLTRHKHSWICNTNIHIMDTLTKHTHSLLTYTQTFTCQVQIHVNLQHWYTCRHLPDTVTLHTSKIEELLFLFACTYFAACFKIFKEIMCEGCVGSDKCCWWLCTKHVLRVQISNFIQYNSCCVPPAGIWLCNSVNKILTYMFVLLRIVSGWKTKLIMSLLCLLRKVIMLSYLSPSAWNSLPVHVTNDTPINTFSPPWNTISSTSKTLTSSFSTWFAVCVCVCVCVSEKVNESMQQMWLCIICRVWEKHCLIFVYFCYSIHFMISEMLFCQAVHRTMAIL